jgi:hypothetical protein
LWYRNDLLRFRFLFRSGSGSGFGSRAKQADNINHSFQKQKMAQNLVFLMSEAAYLPESWPFIYDFLPFFLHFMLDLDPIPDPES